MKIVMRGYEPKDILEFGSEAAEKLNKAAEELYYLVCRGYDMKSASTFVGNHYLLSERQRMALARMISPIEMLNHRRNIELSLDTPPKKIWVDGFNIIITLEVALSGSLLIEGMDGTIRDLAGLRGTYRVVDKTVQAVELFLEHLEKLQIQEVVLCLDQPVSNSGRLRGLLLEKAENRPFQLEVELMPNVDVFLSTKDCVVTTDAIILNHCGSWCNLARWIITHSIPQAWIFGLNLKVESKPYSEDGT